MTEPDDMLDEDADNANRTDVRRAIVITVIALATVLVASLFVVLGGFPT